ISSTDSRDARHQKCLAGRSDSKHPRRTTGGTSMQPRGKRLSGFMIVVGIAGILTGIGCARMSDDMSSTKAKMAEAGRAAATTLSGTQEAPPVNTQGTATSSIVVSGDKNISGSIEVNG